MAEAIGFAPLETAPLETDRLLLRPFTVPDGDAHGDVEYAITREEWEATDSNSAPRAAP